MLEAIRQLKAQGRFSAINEQIPYAGFVGIECVVEEGDLVTVLRRHESNIGNVQLPAIHGGVIGGFLEHAAIMQLVWELDVEVLPKIVNISIDYLRPALDRDTFARGVIVRQGRRIANVRAQAWQDDEARPVAAAHAHFLLGHS